MAGEVETTVSRSQDDAAQEGVGRSWTPEAVYLRNKKEKPSWTMIIKKVDFYSGKNKEKIKEEERTTTARPPSTSSAEYSTIKKNENFTISPHRSSDFYAYVYAIQIITVLITRLGREESATFYRKIKASEPQ